MKKDKDKNFIAKSITHIVKNFRIYWYLLSVVLLTVFVYCNWTQVTDFVLFSEFNGGNLLFIVWLLLILMPTISKFEGFGVKLESSFSAPLERKVEELIARNSTELYTTQGSINSFEKELSALIEKGGQ